MQTNEILTKIEENISRVIIGKREVTRLILAALAAGGHVLLFREHGDDLGQLHETAYRKFDELMELGLCVGQ